MNTPYTITNLKVVQKEINLNEELFFDTETDSSLGFYSTIKLAQFYQKSWSEVLIVKEPGPKTLMSILDSVTVVMQNSSYDISTIQQQTGTRYVPKKFHDTLLLGRLQFYTETAFTLDNLMFIALGFDPYLGQDINKKDFQKYNWKKNLYEEQMLIYSATDVYYMPQVFEACKEHLTNQIYEIDILTLRDSLDWQNNGFPVDERKRLVMEMKNEMEIAEINCPVNVNSWKQVRPYIGENESDGLALARFEKEGNVRAKEVRRARKLLKQNSFLKKYKTPDNRIYGKFAPVARSGRFTCKDQNLQQLFREGKKVFGYKTGGSKVLVYSDFAQIQLRVACAQAMDKTMAQLFYDKVDVHSFARDKFFEERDKKSRTITKTCNFNLLFGGSSNMLGNIMLKDMDILLPEAQLIKLKKEWLKLWTGIADWQERGIKMWQRGQAHQTPLGRKYLGKLMTDQLAIEIQGAEAEVAKLALYRINKKIKEIPSALLCNMIHDSFILECDNKPEIYQPLALLVGESMKSAWEDMSQYFNIKDIPNPVQVVVGYNWADVENEDLPNVYKLTFN